MTKTTKDNNINGSYYDDVMRRIQEMERKQFEEENYKEFECLNDKNKKYRHDDYHNPFVQYGFMLDTNTIRC